MRETDFSFLPVRKKMVYEQMARSYRVQEPRKKIDWVPFQEKLLESKIAYISIAGAYHKDEQTPFTTDEKSADYDYREIGVTSKCKDIRFTAIDWETSEVKKDCNVIFPAEQLVLLQKEGLIGELNDKIYSLSGYNENRKRLDKTINEIIAKLKENENVGVLIIPTSTVTAETGCILANAIEAAGISTVLLSPFYEQAMLYAPARCAFINFPFGRLLGKANEITLQTAILRELLRLFEKAKVPGEVICMNFIWPFGAIPNW